MYDDQGKYELALADWTRAIEIDPKDANYYNGRCWTRAISGRDLQLALADCTKSLRLRPNADNTLDSRGLVHLRLGRLDDAIADYDAALKINPKKAYSLYGRGITKLRRGDTAGGQADIAAGIAISADIGQVFARWGVTPPEGGAARRRAAAAAAADCSVAETHWKSVMVLDILAAYEDHLKRFGRCAFASLAKARIQMLKK